jgi:plasmid replication initiation protein
MLTFIDVCDRLKQQDEISVLEVLEITSEELVDRFHDKVEEKMDYLADDLEDVVDD